MNTKIIATIGPASDSPEILEKMIIAGLNIARINFSHCTVEEFENRVGMIRKFAKKHGKKVEILQDLQGPRIRVGILPAEGITLNEGDELILSNDKNAKLPVVYVDDKHLATDLRVGDPIFLQNGVMELETVKIKDGAIHTRVVRGGVLYSRKAVNTPKTKLTNSGLTAKDKKDVALGLKHGVEYIAMSFVQTAGDIAKLRKLAGEKAKIVAKIESAIALKHIDEIIQASDGIMVARGDLGIEIPLANVPFVQKNLIRHAIWHKKGSIVATQMLISMVNHDHPTRAEVSDVANAVWEGADAVMLSDETASGKYPLESLKTLVKIAKKAEESEKGRPNYL